MIDRACRERVVAFVVVFAACACRSTHDASEGFDELLQSERVAGSDALSATASELQVISAPEGYRLRGGPSLLDVFVVPAQGQGAAGGASGDSQEDGGDRGEDSDEEPIRGYPPEKRRVGTPIDVDADLARGFPKPNSIFPSRLSSSYYEWKKQLYADTGIKLSFNATLVGQKASDVRDTVLLTGEDTTDVAAGWSLALEGKWEAFNAGEDWQGGLAAVLDWRQTLGNAANPSQFSLQTGSVWGTEFTIIDWDPWFPVLYWEQWAHKDRFVARVGTQSAVQILDFFRFKDGRSSFSNTEFWFPAASMPLPGPGLGASFELWPQENSPLYVVGTMNDMNFTIGETLSWGSAFDDKQFFYGLEVGYNWGQVPTNFDHLHAQVFYGDENSSVPAAFPNKAGGGFKVRGSKQWDRVVGFGSYTYNTAEGGPFGFTLLNNAATAGVAYLRPLDVRGELGLGANWGQPFDSFDGAAPAFQGLNDQYGIETYWRMLLLPDLWITPGVQFIFDPSFNTDVSSLAIGTIKLHLFL